ncbi:acyl-coenzyme A thioesterase [Schizosaccharomyces osmophilus]|uniref:Acyl-coenzyme A thioesterase n=1 Tax=Schizosaccharomyces osmophilus TaxID=2545709 RepID=A0AAE9W9F8_9SCHI|nr:acyl-coenzyme A thioesterase [Schizosaccharomyces osmophilus]WBW72119.1 acyl-coenzyme A thioesterase [Schizosaccharomyces osmophilus]
MSLLGLSNKTLLTAAAGGLSAGAFLSWFWSSDAYLAHRRLPANAQMIAKLTNSPTAVQMVQNLHSKREREIRLQEHPSLFRSQYPSNFLNFRDGILPLFKTYYDSENREWISIGIMGNALTGYQKLQHGGAIATVLIECLQTVKNLESDRKGSLRGEPQDPILTETFDVHTPSYSIGYKKPVPAGDWVLIRVNSGKARLYNSKNQLLAEACDLQA